jgi:hypothetical protein
MAIRLRIVNNLPIALCAVESDPKEGDIYLDDGMHAALSTKFAQDFNNMFGDNMRYTLPVDPEQTELMKTQKVRDAREEFAKWAQDYDVN